METSSHQTDGTKCEMETASHQKTARILCNANCITQRWNEVFVMQNASHQQAAFMFELHNATHPQTALKLFNANCITSTASSKIVKFKLLHIKRRQ